MNMDSNLPFILVTHTMPDGWLDKLEGKCQALVGPVDATELSPELKTRLSDADGLFSLLTIPVDEELLAQAARLRVVSNMAVGVDNIDLVGCTRRGIPVGNTPGVLTEGTADLTMAILLAAARRLKQASQDAQQGRWKTWSPTGWLGADLHGANLGIVGMGKIGRAVARRAVAFGMRLLYCDNLPCADVENDMGAVCLPLDELLRRSDFVSLHTPLSAETRHLIGEGALRKMKSTAILVNTSRGPVVDMAALTQALQEGWIAGAALDVTDPEPLPPEHPLFSLPNCLITPHIGSATWNTRRRMAELACDNLLAGLSGQRMPFCANPEVYKK